MFQLDYHLLGATITVLMVSIFFSFFVYLFYETGFLCILALLELAL